MAETTKAERGWKVLLAAVGGMVVFLASAQAGDSDAGDRPGSTGDAAAGAATRPAPPTTQPKPAQPPQTTWLQDLVVTATRRETLLSDAPGVVQVITRREIEELSPSSTGRLLEYVTGVTVETGTGSGLPNRSVIGLNGLPPNYTLVLVDGVRLLSDHIHSGQNVELIPPQSIERIEIIRGAAAAQYGSDAIGGVVNIITRKCREKLEFSLNGGIGSYDTCESGLALMAPLDKRVRLSMFLNREESEGVPLKAPASRAGRTGYERYNLLGRLEADVTDTTKVFGWVNWVCNTMDWQTGQADSYLVTPVLGTTIKLAPFLDLFAQASYSKWKGENTAEQNELFQPEFRLAWAISEAHTLTGGMDLKHHKFTRSKVEDAPSQDTYGTFVQHEWRPSKHLTLMGALRYDCVEDIDSVLTPKLSVVWSPDLPLRVRGSIGRGFHAPTPQELYEEGYGHGGRALRFGNPDLKPEYSTTYTLGLELFPGGPLEVMLCGHYSDIDEMIVPVYEGAWDKDPGKDVWRRTNIESVKVYGGEIKARYTFSQDVRLEGGFSCTESEEEGTGRRLPYDAGSSAFVKTVFGSRLGADWKWSGFVGLRAVMGRSAWNWKPAAGAPPGTASGMTTELDDYQKLEAGLSVEFKETYRFFVNVDNILGQDIENLDDAYTVIKGEPVLTFGFRAKW